MSQGQTKGRGSVVWTNSGQRMLWSASNDWLSIRKRLKIRTISLPHTGRT